MVKKVISWISYEEVEAYKEAISTMGGFVNGHNWEEYLEHMNYSKNEIEYLEGIRTEILRLKSRFSGEEHQESKVPVFDDNKVATFSWRAWGDLMAAIYNTEEKTREYSYMDFYM